VLLKLHPLVHRCGQKIGPDKVVRVESEPTIDFYGKEALDVLIVIAPGVADGLSGDDVLETLVQISDRLLRDGDERFPIISYATEEELADNDSP